MCKLIIATNTKDNNKPFEQMLKIQFAELKKEPHGIGALIVDKDMRVKTFRAVDNYDEVLDKVKENLGTARLVGLHTRTKTVGSVNLENVHFFEVNGQIMAHNGWISKYHSNTNRYSGQWASGYGFGYNNHSHQEKLSLSERLDKIEFDGDEVVSPPYEQMAAVIASCKGCNDPLNAKGYCKKHKNLWEKLDDYDPNQPLLSDGEDRVETPEKPKAISISDEDFSDSYQFTRDLPRGYGKPEIEAHIEKTGFSGMAFLMDKATLQSYLLIQKESYVIQGKDYAGFFSYTPEVSWSSTNWGWTQGIPYKKGTKTMKLRGKEYTLSRGTWELEVMNLFEAKVELASAKRE